MTSHDQPTPAPQVPTTLSIEVTNQHEASALAQALQDSQNPTPTAVSQFEIRNPGTEHPHAWRIDAYFETPPDIKAMRSLLASSVAGDLPAFQLTPTPNLNWVALSQSALPIVRAGRFTIHGSHDCARVATSQNTIQIDAGEAFGTAHHATTYLCLKAIDVWTRKRNFKNALDLGCGAGILAISLARVAPRCAILATDIDELAIDVTRANARINRVGAQIQTLQATGLAHPSLNQNARFDFILANILANPLIKLARDISRVAKPGAIIVLSGLLTRQAHEVLAAYNTADFSILDHQRHVEWSALVLRKS